MGGLLRASKNLRARSQECNHSDECFESGSEDRTLLFLDGQRKSEEYSRELAARSETTFRPRRRSNRACTPLSRYLRRGGAFGRSSAGAGIDACWVTSVLSRPIVYNNHPYPSLARRGTKPPFPSSVEEVVGVGASQASW